MMQQVAEKKKPVIELKNIFKKFPGVTALKGFDLTIYEKEIMGLVGENGAGKSTLMKILTGNYQPDGGSYLIGGKPETVTDSLDAIRKGVGMVFQEGCTIPNLTVAENIFICHEEEFKQFGMVSEKAMQKAAREMLQLYDIDIDPGVLCNKLSPAELQMVEVTRLLWLSKFYNHDNPVLILDEPTTVLLEKDVKKLFNILNEIKKHATIVLISHRLEEIVEHSDRIVVLKDGDYVTEMMQKDAEISNIEKLMVGRGLATEHYRESEQKVPEDDVVLEVKNLALEGFFDPISFTLRKGEILALVGLIGSGKEELCRCIGGSLRATKGSVSVEGKPVAIQSPYSSIRHNIGYIPIDRRVEGLATDMDIAENINMLVYPRLKAKGLLNSRKEKENAEYWIKEGKVKATSIRMKCVNLSGGNQQKVILAKWLSADSQILLLDHPTRGIDVGAKDEIYHRIRELAKEGKSMIIMCDTLEEDIGLSNRMLIMKDGKLVREAECPVENKPTPLDLIDSIV